MAQAKLKVILLRATPDPDELVALGARGFVMPKRIWTLCSSGWRAAISAHSLSG